VLARWLGLAALAAAVLALAGCGGVTGASSDAVGSPLTIYSSLPLQGPMAATSAQIVNGEKLALAQANGRAGKFRIGFFSLSDSSPSTGLWSPGVTAGNAKTASQDPSTIAYIGDLDSGATAVSLPLMNAVGVLQVSPASPYVGLTSSQDAGQDEPERFYPSAKRTFGRLQPGDPVEAAAQVRMMRALAVRSVYVLDNQDPFQVPLASIVASEAQSAGIKVTGHDSISTPTGAVYTGEIEKILEGKPQAVFLSGDSGAGSAGLWQQLHAADPQLLLLGSSSMASEAFASAIGTAGSQTYLTTPLLPASLYPPAGQRVLSAYRARFGQEGGPWALYGYVAMRTVLESIRSAGSRGNDRVAVTERFFATRAPHSAIGPFAIQANGETTSTVYAVDRVSAGKLAYLRSFSAAPALAPAPTG
jgi:branched-chain amino acid transport system substrate-binding protein